MLLFEIEPLSLKEFVISLVAAFPYVAGFVLYSAGVKYLRPSYASILGNSEVVFNIILAAIILHEVISFGQWTGMVLILGAIILPQLQDTMQAKKRMR